MYNYSLYGEHISCDFKISSLNQLKKKKDSISISSVKEINPSFNSDAFSLNNQFGYFSKKDVCKIEIKDGKNIHYAFKNTISDFQKFQIIASQPFAYLFYQRGKLVLHGSAIEINGRAFLFIGISGSGKSFFASSLLDESKLISEDICVIDIIDDSFYIRPSIPVIKIDNPFIITSKNIKSEHKLIDKRDRKAILLNNSKFTSNAIKIEACFVLNFSKKFSIERVGFNKSFASILLSSFQSNPILSSKINDSDIHQKIGNFLNTIPLYNIKRDKKFNDFNIISTFINKTFFNG